MTSDILEMVHSEAQALKEVGAIDAKTMREFDDLCLPKVKDFTGKEIKKLRENCGLSQPVFAKYLNTTKSTISKWERDEKHPKGTSLKLLNIVEKQGLQALA